MILPYSNQQNISIRSENEFGKVWLIGFGPGDPDLLTMKGYKLLQTCDIIFYDDLTNKEFLLEFSAQKIYVGKRKNKHSIEQEDINRLLLNAAVSGKDVVRLKGGDPMLLAHGGEEVLFLRQHLIDVEVVPGITAAFATTASSQIPLTHRGISSSITFISGHTLKDLHLPKTGTIVVYMGASNIHKIAQIAISEGWASSTPVLMMYNVSNPDQAEETSTLQDIATIPREYKTPLLIIIGKVVNLKSEVLEEAEVKKYEQSKSQIQNDFD